ncbi:MAG: hypothetical protein Q4G21_00110 [Dermabacter sp.]|nr:hypothetical protein [Dermabacter sp.]
MSSTTDRMTSWAGPVAGVLRILIGIYFFWAFLDKTFGLGFATPSERAWLNGGSPTSGFLGGSIEGGNPFAGVWQFFININPVTDILFMAGLFGIGLALILGIGHKIATISGVAMYLFMYLAAFPIATNPLFDDHLLMALVLVLLLGVRAADYVGLGKQWTTLVGEKSILR